MEAHIQDFLAILDAWLPMARIVKAGGGSIAWEWPKNCRLLHHPKVRAVLDEFEPDRAIFDGCAMGLKAISGSRAGLPIRKP